jgi:nucleoside-diphosphate-sugar epimerase
MTKKCLVLGAGGFIGGHLVTRLKSMGHWVRGVDLKYHEHKKTDADEFIIADLRKYSSVDLVIDDTIDEVYQLAADMGGAEYIFSGLNDANVMHNSSIINLHVCDICSKKNIKKVFYSSSACMYPEHNQLDPDNPNCEESSAYPANPDSEYGWEKLFSERMYLAYHKNKNLNVRIARFHNIFGPYGTWKDGKEKAPAAICRKVAQAANGSEIEIFGDGKQTRSFLYIEECLDGILKLMESDFIGPVNIGSDEMVTINQLCDIVCDIANKQLYKKHIDGPLGVRGRNSDNRLIQEKLGWKPTLPLKTGLKDLYLWIDGLIKCSCDEDSTCIQHRPDYNYDDPYFQKPLDLSNNHQ